MIIAHNIVPNGEVVDASSTDPTDPIDPIDPKVQGIRRFNELVAREPRVTSAALQTVGEKGYDGFVLALVVNDSAPKAPFRM